MHVASFIFHTYTISITRIKMAQNACSLLSYTSLYYLLSDCSLPRFLQTYIRLDSANMLRLAPKSHNFSTSVWRLGKSFLRLPAKPTTSWLINCDSGLFSKTNVVSEFIPLMDCKSAGLCKRFSDKFNI